MLLIKNDLFYFLIISVFIIANCKKNPTEVVNQTGPITKVIYSPVGYDSATGILWRNTGIYIVDSNGSNNKQLVPDSLTIHKMIWSNQGDVFFFIGENWPNNDYSLYKCDLNGNMEKLTGTDYGSQIKISPDNQFILFNNNLEEKLLKYHLITNQLETFLDNGTSFLDFCFSPTGERIIYHGFKNYQNFLANISASGGDESIIWSDSFRVHFTSFNWSSDGEKLCFDYMHNSAMNVATLDPDGNNLQILTVGENPRFSPDGQTIMFSGGGSFPPGIHLIERDGSNHREFKFNDMWEGNGEWFPDSRQIAYQERLSGNLFILNAETGESRTMIALDYSKHPESYFKVSPVFY